MTSEEFEHLLRFDSESSLSNQSLDRTRTGLNAIGEVAPPVAASGTSPSVTTPQLQQPPVLPPTLTPGQQPVMFQPWMNPLLRPAILGISHMQF